MLRYFSIQIVKSLWKKECLEWNKLSCIVGRLLLDQRNRLLDGAGEKGGNRVNRTSIWMNLSSFFFLLHHPSKMKVWSGSFLSSLLLPFLTFYGDSGDKSLQPEGKKRTSERPRLPSFTASIQHKIDSEPSNRSLFLLEKNSQGWEVKGISKAVESLDPTSRVSPGV